jgi:hypothetical protein
MNVESQHGSLCGLHALNNIFQGSGTRFWSSTTGFNQPLDAGDGGERGKIVDVDEAVHRVNTKLHELKQEPFSYGGNYAYDVLCEAILMAGCEFHYSESLDRTCPFEPCLGALVHVHPGGPAPANGHWVAIKDDDNSRSVVLDSMTPVILGFADWYATCEKHISCLVFIGMPTTEKNIQNEEYLQNFNQKT